MRKVSYDEEQKVFDVNCSRWRREKISVGKLREIDFGWCMLTSVSIQVDKYMS